MSGVCRRTTTSTGEYNQGDGDRRQTVKMVTTMTCILFACLPCSLNDHRPSGRRRYMYAWHFGHAIPRWAKGNRRAELRRGSTAEERPMSTDLSNQNKIQKGGDSARRVYRRRQADGDWYRRPLDVGASGGSQRDRVAIHEEGRERA